MHSIRRVLTLLIAAALTACGGGGGGGGGSPPPAAPSPAAARLVAGSVMLGAMASADVEIRGTTGVLATGRTDGRGQFGPISYSGTYTGPLRIVATGNAATTYLCDFSPGCLDGPSVRSFGTALPFLGTLEAVVGSPVPSQTVHVSLLSDIAATRMDALGEFSAANADRANREVAESIRGLLGAVFQSGITIPDSFYSVELPDLNTPPSSGITPNPGGAVLALLNSALFGLQFSTETSAQFVDRLSQAIASATTLPVSDPLPWMPSRDILLRAFIINMLSLQSSQPGASSAVNQLLAPNSTSTVVSAAIQTWSALPSLTTSLPPPTPPSPHITQIVNDANLGSIPNVTFEVRTSTGDSLQTGDILVQTAGSTSMAWMTATVVTINNRPHIEVRFLPNVIEDLPNGTHQGIIVLLDGTRRFRSTSISVRLQLSLTVPVPISQIQLSDPILQGCVTAAASAGGLTFVDEVSTLSCDDVSNATGLGVFQGLESLTLPGNSLTSLAEIQALPALEYLDVSGNANLPCQQIDALATRLTLGQTLIVEDFCLTSAPLALGAPGFDLASNDALGLAFVSVPDRREIAVVSHDELRIIDRYRMPGRPFGIDISLDTTRLFAALNGATKVAVIDIDQRSISELLLGDSTGHPSTYDVLEARPDRLFVTASPSSGGIAYVAQVLLDMNGATSRVASGRIIRAEPTLARDPTGQFVYVGEGFSPNSLYKLSLAAIDAPIVLEDDHGSVGGTYNLAVSPTGFRIALGNGQVLRTGSFVQEGTVPAGRSVAATDSETLFVARPAGLIEAYNFGSLVRTGTTNTACNFATTSRIASFNDDAYFLLLQDSVLCLYGRRATVVPPDQSAAFRFLDLGLEECVIAAAIAGGFTSPQQIIQLDCSDTVRHILSLEGIERLTNLQLLDISGNDISDLGPVAGLDNLRNLVAMNAGVTSVQALLALDLLTSADLRGNPAIRCGELDQLSQGGVAVTADFCADTESVELGGIGAELVVDVPGNRAFVSVPSLQQIVEVDLGTGGIARRLALVRPPRGIDLSQDRQTIYAALQGAGDIAYVDVATAATQIVDVSSLLGDDRTWDVAEVSANRIVVSSNPGSNGFAYIVEVRRDQANAAQRVAGGTIIRAAPIFAVSADGASVYVGESIFSPESLYKLDATQANLPIVLEDDHGEVGGADNLALSPDGTAIYLSSGQGLDTATFEQIAAYGQGRSAVTHDGQNLLVASATTDSATEYDLVTTAPTGQRHFGCNLGSVAAIEELGSGGLIVLGDDLLCYTRTVSYP